MIKLSGTSTTTCKTSYPGFCYKLCRANVRCSLKVNGWLHRTLSLLHSCLRRARKKRLGCLRRTPRRLAGRLASPNSPQGGVSVGFAELPAGWRVGSCSIGVRLRLKPKFNITLQAEPAFDRLTAGQRLNPTIRSIENAISLLIRMKPAFFTPFVRGSFYSFEKYGSVLINLLSL